VIYRALSQSPTMFYHDVLALSRTLWAVLFILYYFSQILSGGVRIVLIYLLIVWCCDIHYDFRLKPILSLSYLQSYFCYLCLFASNGVTYLLTTSLTCGYFIGNRIYLHLSSCISNMWISYKKQELLPPHFRILYDVRVVLRVLKQE